MRKTFLFAAALSALVPAVPAQAQAQAVSQPVSSAGLDLGSPAGRARFQRRLAAAIEDVCGSYAGASHWEQREIGRCRATARADIETQLAAMQSRRHRWAIVGARAR